MLLLVKAKISAAVLQSPDSEVLTADERGKFSAAETLQLNIACSFSNVSNFLSLSTISLLNSSPVHLALP